MRKFLITLHVMVNDKKITAIKDVRSATGMGLGAAKTFCETYIMGTLDSCGGELIVNGEQVARLLALDISSRGRPAFGEASQPSYAITKIVEIAPPSAVDISDIIV
jgi:hypothetical protein